MKWKCFKIYHSQKNAIDLYCRQIGDEVEIYITNSDMDNLEVLQHDILTGQVHDLTLDQHSNKIDWKIIDFDFSKFICLNDMNIARIRQGQKGQLNFLKYHIAKAINTTHKNRGYSRYLKKNIIGGWEAGKLQLKFYDNGEYSFTGNSTPSTILVGVPTSGTYHLSRNMILFWDPENIGVRTQIVDLGESEMIFPGNFPELFHKMSRK